jgi:hypothetical protein
MGEPMRTNVLHYGDNLDILRRYLPDVAVDLVYLDPPFNSNRDYNVIFRDESGNATDAQLLAFEDRENEGPVRWRALLGSLLGLFLLNGCAGFDRSILPAAPTQSESAEIGVRYQYNLYDHCGLNALPTQFDGSEWLIEGDTGGTNPPDGFGNPFDEGTIILDSHNSGTYRSSGGVERRITRVDPRGPRPSYLPNCL